MLRPLKITIFDVASKGTQSGLRQQVILSKAKDLVALYKRSLTSFGTMLRIGLPRLRAEALQRAGTSHRSLQ